MIQMRWRRAKPGDDKRVIVSVFFDEVGPHGEQRVPLVLQHVKPVLHPSPGGGYHSVNEWVDVEIAP